MGDFWKIEASGTLVRQAVKTNFLTIIQPSYWEGDKKIFSPLATISISLSTLIDNVYLISIKDLLDFKVTENDIIVVQSFGGKIDSNFLSAPDLVNGISVNNSNAIDIVVTESLTKTIIKGDRIRMFFGKTLITGFLQLNVQIERPKS